METLWTRRDMMKGIGMATLAMGLGGPYGSAHAAHAQSNKGKDTGKAMTDKICSPSNFQASSAFMTA